MAQSTFYARVEELSRRVGSGLLMGQVRVEQVYAHYQDSGIGPPQNPHIPASAFHHPRGGRAGYLSDSFAVRGPLYLERLAAAVTASPEPLWRTMEACMDDLAEVVYRDAPREFWVLRNSASPRVEDDGRLMYLRPASIPRLSQAELNAIRRFAGNDVWVNGEAQHQSWVLGGAVSRALRHERGYRPDHAAYLLKRRYGR